MAILADSPVATLGFFSKSGWIVTAGHAFEPTVGGVPFRLILRGLPQSCNAHSSIHVYQPSLDVLLAKLDSPTLGLPNMAPAHLALHLSNAVDKPKITVQWYDENQIKQSESVPFTSERVLVHVVVIRKGRAHAIRVRKIRAGTNKFNQDHDRSVYLTDYISVDILGDTLVPGDSGSPLVLTTQSGQHVVLGFLRGVFKSPLIGLSTNLS